MLFINAFINNMVLKYLYKCGIFVKLSTKFQILVYWVDYL